MSQVQDILLVHGAWHGSWVWERVTPLLTAEGKRVHVVDLPSVHAGLQPPGDLRDDAEVVRAAIHRIDAPVAVVAHSYGGAPCSEAAAGLDSVHRLVYLAAFVLDTGESLQAAVGGKPPDWWNVNAHEGTVTPARPQEIFYNDCTRDDTAWAVYQLAPHTLRAFQQTQLTAAWHDIPSSYIVCDADNAIPPEAQRVMARRTGDVLEMHASHSPFLSQPLETAAALLQLI
jgi:pimeloyl-ACP methyl ester carboxylesterase